MDIDFRATPVDGNPREDIYEDLKTLNEVVPGECRSPRGAR